MSTNNLPIAIRAFAESAPAPAGDPPATGQRRRNRRRWPSGVLALDMETTTDATQRLTFGSYRSYRWDAADQLVCVAEGLIHADDLPARDPEGFAILRGYARTHTADVVSGVAPTLHLISRRAFLRTFFKVAYKTRALIVGFNLPFDLSRLAFHWGNAREKFAGGFSLALWEYQQPDGTLARNPQRPLIGIKQLDSKRALKGFTRRSRPDPEDLIPEDAVDGQPDEKYAFRGHFLDLRTLVFALTNESHSLASACAAFGMEHGKEEVAGHGVIGEAYIAYNRRDVGATAALLAKVRAEYDRHEIELQPTLAYSPASIAKAYLRAMGVTPILDREGDDGRGFPRAVLGYAMAAYYGGRAECRIRRTPVPVTYLDFLSMYPTVNVNMGLAAFHRADRVEAVDDTERVRAFLSGITLEHCFDPVTWKAFPVLVQLHPQGDILPVRAPYEGVRHEKRWRGREPALGGNLQIGINPVWHDGALWYALPDVVAAKLLGDTTPEIVRAIRLVPVGLHAGLTTVRLRGAVPIDPRRQDLFKTMIEERKRIARDTGLGDEERDRLDQSLKVNANSGSYGIFAEMIRHELPGMERAAVTVHGLDTPFTCKVHAPETPGAFCFPPIAACITAGARLMLAMLERCVTEMGGAYAFCDTDSMAIVANEHGGLVACPNGPERLPDGRKAVRALSWAEVGAIVARFARLNPYDHAVIPGSVLEIEKENFDRPKDADRRQRPVYCYAISAKRYALFTLDGRGEPVLVKWSEHGLGHLLNPTDPGSDDRDWIRAIWEGLVREALGLPVARPDWLDRPALSRLSASSPGALRPFATFNAGKPYADQIKPFNWMLSVHVRPVGHPDGVDPARFHLIAPYESDAGKWLESPWFDLYTDTPYQITTRGDYGGRDVARVKTYADVLDEYRIHREEKSADADGMPCRRETVGLLRRRPVHITRVVYIGKEANELEDVEAGQVHDGEEVLTEYRDPRRDPWCTIIVPVMREMSKLELSRLTGISERQIQRYRNDSKIVPHDGHRAALTRAIADFARIQLKNRGDTLPPDDCAVCATYLLLK